MTPITKKVILIDENGNQLGFTYSKRAKGFIKKGRAYLTPDGKVCMICPPYKMEDNNMSDINNTAIESNVTAEEILKRIDAVSADTEHLKIALQSFSEMYEIEDGYNAAAEDAVKETVLAREATNQQVIALLDKIYSDIRPENSSPEKSSSDELKNNFQMVADTYKQLYPNGLSHEAEESLHKIASQIFN